MKKITLLLSAFIFLVATAQAFAASNLQLVGTNLDPVQISANSIQIMDISNSSDIYGPLQIIIGIPNEPTSFTAPTMTSPSPNTVVKTVSLTSGKEAYSALGLPGPTNKSNSFTNWAAADLTINGITATNFDLIQYSLSSQTITGKHSVTLDFSSNLPLGTYIIAYAAHETNSKGNPEATPFTEAGLVTNHQVPEPSTLLLLGSGLVGLGLVGRKKLTK